MCKHIHQRGMTTHHSLQKLVPGKMLSTLLIILQMEACSREDAFNTACHTLQKPCSRKDTLNTASHTLWRSALSTAFWPSLASQGLTLLNSTAGIIRSLSHEDTTGLGISLTQPCSGPDTLKTNSLVWGQEHIEPWHVEGARHRLGTLSSQKKKRLQAGTFLTFIVKVRITMSAPRI